MRALVITLSVIFLSWQAAAADELRFEEFSLRIGATTQEVTEALPSELKLTWAPSRENRQGHIAPRASLEEPLAFLTFDDGKLVGATRLIGPPDYSGQPATLLTGNIVKTLAQWRVDDTAIDVVASNLAEGDDIVQELLFSAGAHRLVLIRTHQMTQLVEHLGKT